MELLDREVLQACMNKNHLDICNEFRKDNILCETAREVLTLYDRYFKAFKGKESFDSKEFVGWLEMIKPTDQEKLTLLMGSLDNKEYTQDHIKGIVSNLTVHKHMTAMQSMIDDYTAGDLEDPMGSMKVSLDKSMDILASVDSGMINTATPSEVFKAEDKDGGLTWFSKGIAEICHSVLVGRFIIFAASVNGGKTSFVLNNVNHWLKEIKEDEKIAWVNNEETTTAIKMRMYQSILGMTEFDINKFFCKFNEDGEPVLEDGKHVLDDEAFEEHMTKLLGFRLEDKMHIFDAHNRNYYDIEAQLKKDNYRVIIFDMLDNVQFPSTGNGGQADIEARYKWARALASVLKCTVVATSQVSVEGMNCRLPQQEFLKDSRVVKQGQADLILTVGASEQDKLPVVNNTMLYSKTVGAPKNKMINVKNQHFKYACDLDRSVPIILDAKTAKMYDLCKKINDRGEEIHDSKL